MRIFQRNEKKNAWDNPWIYREPAETSGDLPTIISEKECEKISEFLKVYSRLISERVSDSLWK